MRRAVLLLLVGALVVGCSSGTSPHSADKSSSSSSPSATPPPAPVIGSCHRLGFAQAAQPTDATPAVPCTSPHTAQTVKVGQVAAVTGGQDARVDSAEVRDKVAQACPARLLRYAGGDLTTRRLSRLAVVSFTPTAEQAKAGASWFRCDIVGLAAANQLIRLPRQLKGALDPSDALDRFGTCGTTAPGKSGFERVVCRRRHAWQAVSTVTLDGSARYLGPRATAQGDARCKDAAAARAKGALKYTWSFEWPTRDQWKAGQRYGYCWVPAA
jgi:hypothetical protein